MKRRSKLEMSVDSDGVDRKPWHCLPSVVICEIFDRLSPTDRLNATAVCQRWRSFFWYPKFWRKLNCHLRLDTEKPEHLLYCRKKLERCGAFVQEAIIDFDSCDSHVVREACHILQELQYSKKLQKLVLKPTSCEISFEYEDKEKDDCGNTNTTISFIQSLEQVLRCSMTSLRHLSLGCASNITDHSDTLLGVLLSQPSVPAVEVLHIASLKEVPDSYQPINLPPKIINSFCNLHTLGIDYDHLSNEILNSFSDIGHSSLRRLFIHVHIVLPEHQHIMNKTWLRLTSKTDVEVTLNLIHSESGITRLVQLLSPAMPLVHFRAFFCMHVNIEGIEFIRNHLGSKLKSVLIIDGIADVSHPNVYPLNYDEDPFVMLAWKSPMLESFTLIGYKICDDDIVAIARLCGNSLKTLEIPHCCIDVTHVTHPSFCIPITDMISESLGFSWKPIPDEELHPTVLDPNVDAETVYLSILQMDQE